MKLQRVPPDDIVTVRFADMHYAVAEAHELKAAGFGQREVLKDCPGEWQLLAESQCDFESLARAIPAEAEAVWQKVENPGSATQGR